MKMLRVAIPLVAFGVVLAACPRQPPPEPEPIVRVDTVVVTREVPPPLPEGTARTLCLATGEEVQVLIGAQGDTLVGPQRARARDLRPAMSFAGNYAAGTTWFAADEPIMFDRREYVRVDSAVETRCAQLKIVGEHRGVNLFADVQAEAPFSRILVPVRPGQFQPYQTDVARVRG